MELPLIKVGILELDQNSGDMEVNMMDKSSGIPLYLQLAEHLRDLIYTGEFDGDSKLPTETFWMKKYGLGRATVRAALSKLKNEDLIYKKQGTGTFIKKQTVSSGMLPIISFNYILKSMGITTQNQVLENRSIILEGDLKKKFQNDNLNEIYLIKRMRFAKEYPVAIETSYFTMETAKQFQGADVTGSVAELLLSNSEIKLSRIIQDIESKDPTDKERELLKLKKNESVLVMNRWLYKSGETTPFSFLEFVLPQTFLTYPFRYQFKA